MIIHASLPGPFFGVSWCPAVISYYDKKELATPFYLSILYAALSTMVPTKISRSVPSTALPKLSKVPP